MILSWMTYALVVGALITLAAAAADHVARLRNRPTRIIWAATTLGALLWPIVNATRALRPALQPSALPFTLTLAPLRVVADAGVIWRADAIDTVLLWSWVLASTLLLARLAADALTLRRVRRAWPIREVDGRPLRLTTDAGPAVIGVASMEIVVPEWILSLDEPLRALVLRHEEEHRAARDPHLLLGARLVSALLPWSPAVWYAAHRLRLAIELDCDARVLRAQPSPSPRRYGMLLLTIAQRRSSAPTALAPMLSEPTTQLERRILAMRPRHHRFARLTTIAGVLAAASALALACSVQSDAPTASTASKSVSAKPAGFFEFKLTKEAKWLPGSGAPRYPDQLRAAHVEGSVVAQFVVGADGIPDANTLKVVRSTDPQFTSSVKNALPMMRFTPAEVKGHAVKQLVTMPFQFSLQR
jgi:TonB family protein